MNAKFESTADYNDLLEYNVGDEITTDVVVVGLQEIIALNVGNGTLKKYRVFLTYHLS